jgi:PIN domain nuclease of toxin-antitoxin system
VKAVLDASALLALLKSEPGHEQVQTALLGGAAIHVVNWAETLSKLAEAGVAPADVERDLIERGVLHEALVVDFGSPTDAVLVAELRIGTRSAGLSLGDRFCLALGRRLGLPVLTADRAWSAVHVGVTVQVIR